MYVVASNRPWHAHLAVRLSELTGKPFQLLDKLDDFCPEKLSKINPEMIFLPHWSHIIPASVYARYECVVFHMTDLPYGRGGSPLQNLIVRGHTETVVSALRCEAGLDTGPIYLKKPLNLQGSAQDIFLRATEIIVSMIVEMVFTKPVPKPQSGDAVTFLRRKPADGDLSAVGELDKIYDHIRMLDAEGYPPAYLDFGDFRVQFTDAQKGNGSVSAKAEIIFRNETIGG
jgi:methionyl-tRNA formyltransferase